MKTNQNHTQSKSSSSAISRRNFLQKALMAGVAPMFIPYRRLFGEATPSKALNLAIIGCGSRPQYMLGLADNAQVKVVAAVDIFKSRREAFATHFNAKYGNGVCKPYLDFREIIASNEIDAVLISTPDHWHVPIAMEAIKNNKHVFVEKPLGVSLEDEFRLRKAFAEKKLKFQYGTQQRSTLFARTAVDLVRNGYVGEINRVDVWSPALGTIKEKPSPEIPVPEDFDYDLYTGPSIKKPYTKERCTKTGSWHCYEHAIGFIAGWGAHPLDILQWGLNTDHTSPVSYEGTGVHAPEGSLFNTTRAWDMHLTYENGVKVHFMDLNTAEPVITSYHKYWNQNGTIFHGTEGFVCYSRGACYYYKNGQYSNVSAVKFRPEDKRLVGENDHLDNFFNAILNNGETVSPLEAAIRSDTISHLSDVVIRTGKPVRWDPVAEKLVEGTPEQQSLLSRPMRAPYVF